MLYKEELCEECAQAHTVSTSGAASLPAAPMGEVAGVMLWTLRPRLWEGPGAGAAPGGPGGVSLCGDVSGVVGWDEEPPASRARRLRRICRGENPSEHLCLHGQSARTAPGCPPALPHGGDWLLQRRRRKPYLKPAQRSWACCPPSVLCHSTTVPCMFKC